MSSDAVCSRQEALARAADPGGGTCLLTRSAEDVQRAWGWPTNTLNVDTRYNLLFLREDWRHLFDQGKFMLIPTLDDLRKLRAFTDSNRFQRSNIKKRDINTLWKDKATFEYHVLATPELTEPICRFDGPERETPHTTHLPPFADLGPVISHVQPHFVVLNSAAKFAASGSRVLRAAFAAISHNPLEGELRTLTIDWLYSLWVWQKGTELDCPSCTRTNRDSSHSPSNEDSRGYRSSSEDIDSRPSEPEETDSIECENQSSSGDQEDSVESLAPDSDVDGTANSAGDTLWAGEVSEWARKCLEAASQAGWEPDIVNDEQVVDYSKENPWYAPPPESWAQSVPRFKPSKKQGKRWDTARFCSNDWVIYYGNRPLFGRGR